MGHFRKIRRPRPSLRRAWDHRRCGTWLFRRMALKRAVYFLSPQNLPKPPKTTQNPPKAFLAPAGQRTKATSNTFFLAFKAPSIYFYCVQACRLPGFKPFKTLQNPPKPPKPSKGCRPTHQGHINSFCLAFKAPSLTFYWRSSLPFARLQTLQYPPKPPKTPKNSPKPSKSFFSTPDPAGQRTKATSTAFSWPSRRNQ